VSAATGLEASINHQPAVLPADVIQFYLPPTSGRGAPAGAELEYQPHVLGFAEISFIVDKKTGKEHAETVRLLARPAAPGHPTDWAEAEAVADHLADAPPALGRWASVPGPLDTARKLKALEKAFAEYLYSSRKLALFQNRPLGLVSEPGETAEAFRARCRAAAHERAGQALEMEKLKFRPKFEALDATLPDDRREEKKAGSLFDWINPFRSAAPEPAPLSSRQEEKVRKLTADYLAKKAELIEKWKRVGDEATAVQVKPRKADVRVTHFGIGWVPCWRRAGAGGKVELMPAYR
jgi:hypothetical protein